MAVRDLFADLQDGRVLMKLLESISGEKLGAMGRKRKIIWARNNTLVSAKGNLRIHELENVQKALDFLSSKKVQGFLENEKWAWLT